MEYGPVVRDLRRQQETVRKRRLRDLTITIRFYEEGQRIKFEYNSSKTVEKLMRRIRGSLEPPTDHIDSSWPTVEIRENVMLIFRGKDLLKDGGASRTLRDCGMKGQVVVFVIHPGPFTETPEFAKSSKLQYLVEYAMEAAESGTPPVEFLKIIRESFKKKIIFVEIPISEGTDLLSSIKIKLTDRISNLKCLTQCTMLWASELPGLRAGLASLGSFDLLFNGSVLDPKMSLAECGIEEHSKVSLSWKFRGIHISLPLQVNDRMFPKILDIDCYDTIRKMKARVHQVTGISPEKQLLRYQNRWLVEDSKSLVDCGIRVCPRAIFPWCPRISDLEIFPSGAWCAKLFPRESRRAKLFPRESWRAKLCRWDSTLHIAPSTEGVPSVEIAHTDNHSARYVLEIVEAVMDSHKA